MLARLLLSLFVSFAAVDLAAADAGDGPCPLPGTQQEFPQILGPAFERKSTHDFESKAAGYGCSVRYKHPSGMWADVYVYNAGLGEIKDVERDPRLLEEFKQSVAGIASTWEKEHQSKLSETNARYEQRGREHKTEVMSAWALIDSPKLRKFRTHVLLWSGRGVIWKLRVTFEESDREVSQAATIALGDALVDLSRATP